MAKNNRFVQSKNRITYTDIYKMKKYILTICCIIVLIISSCKKALDINVNQTFVEVGGKSAGSLGFSGIILTLMPDGKADFLNSGDIMERGTYEVSGKNLTVKINNKKYRFKVISNSELKYENDRILTLRVQ